MNRQIIGTSLHTVYESIEDFEENAPKWYAQNTGALEGSVFSRHAGGYRWFGAENAKVCMDKIRDGWPEMLVKLLQMWGKDKPELTLATSMVKVRRRKRVRADYGDTLHMDRVWNGDLQHAWERPERVYRLSASQRHATIFIDLGTTCLEDAESVLWRAAAALLICELLQRAGRAVEIYVGSSSRQSCVHSPIVDAWNAMRVKQYTQPLNPENLAAMVTMAFFRTYGFIMIAASGYQVSANFGYPMNKGLPVQLQERQEAGELVVRIGHCNSRELAQQEFAKVRDALAKDHTEEEAA